MFKQISVLFFICFLCVSAFSQTQQTEQSPKGIAILSRPQPKYADEAREKGIEGTVTLRITFLASGEIGDVAYVSESSKKKKLTKYGLVAEAIAAAKQIKFEPQKKNGQPITVTKVASYTFAIYPYTK